MNWMNISETIWKIFQWKPYQWYDTQSSPAMNYLNFHILLWKTGDSSIVYAVSKVPNCCSSIRLYRAVVNIESE